MMSNTSMVITPRVDSDRIFVECPCLIVDSAIFGNIRPGPEQNFYYCPITTMLSAKWRRKSTKDQQNGGNDRIIMDFVVL